VRPVGPLLVLALLAAGCAAPAPAPEEEARQRCYGGDEGCPFRAADAACATLAVEAAPQGDALLVTARLRNVCDERLWVQGNNLAAIEKSGMSSAVHVEGRRYHLMDGAAWENPIVLPMLPPGDVLEPGAELVASWSWNGTLAEGGGRYTPAPRGPHAVSAWLVRASDVRAEATAEWP